ncbi:MAG: hypothetical protein Q4G46_01700 [Propionibacteriaceae bacterium]|nr:hypothetical protein [Propionibacteriaceae bacterium]
MLPLITPGEVHTWLLVALAVACGIAMVLAAVRIVRGRTPRAELIPLVTEPHSDADLPDDPNA